MFHSEMSASISSYFSNSMLVNNLPTHSCSCWLLFNIKVEVMNQSGIDTLSEFLQWFFLYVRIIFIWFLVNLHTKPTQSSENNAFIRIRT